MAIQDNPWTEQSSGCTVDLRTENDEIVVVLSGELDLAAAPYLRERLVDALKDNPPHVRVDVSKVEFLGSPSIGLLVTTCKRVKQYGGSFSVICGSTLTRQVLEIEGLVEFLNVDHPG